MAALLYGAGLRQIECLALRVKDIDFAYRQIIVRDGKGARDRATMLPENLVQPLHSHLGKVRLLHRGDRREGCGEVWLPHALFAEVPARGVRMGLAVRVRPASARWIHRAAPNAGTMSIRILWRAR